MNKNEVKPICKWLINGESTCSLTRKTCHEPFTCYGSRSKDHPEFALYSDCTALTKPDIYKSLQIHKGDIVAEYILPYSGICFHVGDHVMFGIGSVHDKFYRIGYYDSCEIYTFYNVKLDDSLIGILIIGIVRYWLRHPIEWKEDEVG